MAAEIQHEYVSPREATEIFSEVLGYPFTGNMFAYLVSSGAIAPSLVGVRTHRKFARSDILRLAQERKELDDKTRGLLTTPQVLERARDRGIPLRDYELHRLIRRGELSKAYVFPENPGGGHSQFFFDPHEVEAFIEKLIDFRERRAKANGLMASMEAVNWINKKLEEKGEERRIDYSLFYKWIERGLITPTAKVPGKNHHFMPFAFSEADLMKAPPLMPPPPKMPDDVEIVEVFSTRGINQLEAKWGELVTRKGAYMENLSVHAIAKGEFVRPVGRIGQNYLVPLRYIPKRRKWKEKINL